MGIEVESCQSIKKLEIIEPKVGVKEYMNNQAFKVIDTNINLLTTKV